MVSVILCTFNRENTIKESIQSVLEQTYQDWELIIVDDGSTDGTREILESCQDERVKLIFLPENSYYMQAVNLGMKEASGKYIAFATSDDVWEKTKLEKQVACLDAHEECGAVFSHIELIDGEGRKITGENGDNIRALFDHPNGTRAEWMRRFFEEGNRLCHPTSMVRKEVMDSVGGYNILYAQAADMELWIRILQKTDIFICQEQLIRYRWWSQEKQVSGGGSVDKLIREEHEQLWIRREMLENMEPSLFREAFGDRFRNPESASETELAFEKIFLLFDMAKRYPGLRMEGLAMADRILRKSGAADVLKETFGMRIQELYGMTGEICLLTSVEAKKRKALTESIAKKDAQIKLLNQELFVLLDSKWWRWTEPGRKVFKNMKKYLIRR